MTEVQIIARMVDYLHQATTTLAGWLEKKLPRLSKDWWQDCVLNVLNEGQMERLSSGEHVLASLDLAMLLTVTDRNWINLRDTYRLNGQDRRAITAVRGVRNTWSHCGSVLPGKETVETDLETLYAFFECLSADYAFLGKIRSFQNEIRRTEFLQPVHAEPQREQRAEGVQSEIVPMSEVFLVSNPKEKGLVTGVTAIGGEKWYTVFINGASQKFNEKQIAPVEQGETYQKVSDSELRHHLTAFQVTTPARGSLYSMNSARIDFVPYQFRPALKVIQAEQPRLLVADSVGVGKTIEAGLIMKELQARSGAESVLIICPKPLVAERKWELEMKRFDETFTQMNSEDLRRAISDTHRDGVWPDRYRKAIVPYSILTGATLDGVSAQRGKKNYGLFDLDPAPQFDLVIVDEAHHIRNRSTLAYAGVEFFCRNANAVVLLTATPVQTGDDNLYTLLNLLRPDVVTDPGTFQLMGRPNPYINKAAHIARLAQDGWQREALLALEEACNTQWGSRVIRNNPRYQAVREVLAQPTVSREERVGLISDIESLHSFSGMINRTRRQDIQDFCVRHSHTLEVPFTDSQRVLHDALLTFEAKALAALHGNQNVAFMMGTLRRQAASCIFGLAPFLKNILSRRLEQIWDDPDFEIEDSGMDDKEVSSTLQSLAADILGLAEVLPEDDPKFEAMLRVIEEKQEESNNKVIIFSSFKHTLAYLRSKLESQGLRVSQIDGSVKDEDRVLLRDRFKQDRACPEALDILLFTEVGCEGLDYQFCDMMINYDLPWNPMRIEQRIGRIDRRGQKSEVVNIYNMITSGTIDADIYSQCLLRIGVFEGSIGECSEILGQLTRSIQDISLDFRLTDEERRAKLDQMADNEVRKVQEMRRLEQEEKQLFGFDLSGFAINQEIQNAENQWVAPEFLEDMISGYLQARLEREHSIQGEHILKNLRLSAENKRRLLEDYRSLALPVSQVGREWERYLKDAVPNCQITFDSECADQNRKAMFITVGHPLTRQAAAYFSGDKPLYFAAKASCDDVPAGEYPCALYVWDYQGNSPQHRLVAVCQNTVLQGELLELLQTARSTTAADQAETTWDDLEMLQHRLWLQAREVYQKDAAANRDFKRESLAYHFENQQRELQFKLQEATDERIRRMYASRLAACQQNYTEKLDMLETDVKRADIYVHLIARGIFRVE